MPTKSKAGFIGALAVVAILTLQAVERWTVIDAVIAGLRSKGGAGVFIADMLLSPIVPLVIAIASIYLVLEGRKEKSHDSLVSGRAPSTPASQSEIKNSGNVSTSGNVAKATIGDITVYTTPPPVSSVPRPLPKAKLIHVEPPVPVSAKVDVDASDVWKEWHGLKGGVQALLLPFYFDPDKSDSGVYLEYAKVHLEFAPDNPELNKIRVDHACWLNEIYDTTTISLGETKRIVLVLDSREENGPLHTVSTNKTEAHWYTTHEDPMELIALPRLSYSVKSVLIWGGNSNFKRVFSFKLDLTKRLV